MNALYTRREILRGAVSGAFFHATKHNPFFHAEDLPLFQNPETFDFLNDLDPAPDHLRLPSNLRGVFVNMPFAWDRPASAATSQLIDQAIQLHASNIRLIIDDRLLAPDGTYNRDVVRKIERFANLVREKTSGKTGIIATLYDDNFPGFETKARPEFFDSKIARNAFKERLTYLVSLLETIQNITAWGVGNEIEVREVKPAGIQKAMLTDFFVEMVDVIRREDPSRWILTGTRKAHFIDDRPFASKRVAVTDHEYPAYASESTDASLIFDPNDAKELTRYLQTMTIPLVVEEIGVNRNHQYLTDFIASAIKTATVSPLFSRPRLMASSYGLWALGTDDGFDVSPEKHPALTRALPTINTFLQK